MSQYAYTDDESSTAEEIATAMCDVVQSKVYPGGSVVQITTEGMSIIPLDPPVTMGAQEIVPVREIMKAERGASL